MIYFYLPRHHLPEREETLGSDTDAVDWADPKDLPSMLSRFGDRFFLSTPLAWIFQSYLRLKEVGADVALVHEIPQRGVFVALSGDVPLNYKPGRQQYFVSVTADGCVSTYAQMRVCQNRTQTRYASNALHMPHWPQPGILGRDPRRGDRFDTIAFFGDKINLAKELQSTAFFTELTALGLKLSIRDAHSPQRIDYSDIDSVIAVRSFQKHGYIRKPASKLYNAWIAGVTAVLGREYAFTEERRTALDFIEVTRYEDCLAAVRRLKQDRQLRIQMFENGLERAREFTSSSIIERWCRLLFEDARFGFERWSSLSEQDIASFARNRITEEKLRAIRYRWLRMLRLEQNAL